MLLLLYTSLTLPLVSETVPKNLHSYSKFQNLNNPLTHRDAF